MESVLVLIAQPGSGAITPDIVQKFGALERWLHPGEACEITPKTHAEIPANLPIDMALVPRHNRRKRLLIADMDSTMIEQECIDELGEVAGCGDHIRAVTAKAMRGEIDFEGALRERVALLKGLDESVIAQLLKDRISFMPGGKTLLTTMRKHGAYAALVSGGFTAFTGPVAYALGFDEHRANTLEIRNGNLTGKVLDPILGAQAKLESLHDLINMRGILLEDSIAVGDGANDLPVLKAAGLGVALHAKPHVQQQVNCRINHGDLTALLFLQGYSSAEFT